MKAEKDEDDVFEFLMELHPTQVVTLFTLIFGMKGAKKLENRFAQVGTGEGKSVILAFTSTYFALLGYEVNCACYSEYLSARDRANFSELFSALDIENNIKYGTFNELCKDMLNSKNGSIQDSIKKAIT